MKKVKKFGRGGDILTGLGAGLMGYALYKKLKGEDKDEKELESVKNTRTLKQQIGASDGPKERSKEEKRALATSKGRDELIPEGADEAVMRSDNYPTPKPKPSGPPKPAAQKTKVGTGASGFPVDNDALNRRRLEGLKTPGTKDTSSTTSGVKGTQDVGKALGISSGAKGTQTLADRIKGTVESAGKSVARTPAERIAENARLVEERRKREAEGMKKGGKVKKYAEGGKVEPKKNTMPEWAKNARENQKKDELNKREGEGAAKEVKRNMSTFGFKSGGTASRRADGIAQRGKTRGRIC